MSDLTSISNAVSSNDAATIMQGYVDTLAQPDSKDRKAVLDYLLAKIPHSSGDLRRAFEIAEKAFHHARGTRAEEAVLDAYFALLEPAKASGDLVLAMHIAENASDGFDDGPKQREAVAAYWGLFEPMRASGNLVSAAAIAGNAYGLFHEGTAEQQAAFEAYRGLFEPVMASGDLELADAIARNTYCWCAKGTAEEVAAKRALHDVRDAMRHRRVGRIAGTVAKPKRVTMAQIAKTVQALRAGRPVTASLGTP